MFAMQHSLYVTSFCSVANNCFHVDNMKQLLKDIHIDSIMAFLDK